MPVGIPPLILAPWRGWVQNHMLLVPSEDPRIQADITMHFACELSDNLCKISGNFSFFDNMSCIFTLWAAILDISRSLRSQINLVSHIQDKSGIQKHHLIEIWFTQNSYFFPNQKICFPW